jgi:hypothetical protein
MHLHADGKDAAKWEAVNLTQLAVNGLKVTD